MLQKKRKLPKFLFASLLFLLLPRVDSWAGFGFKLDGTLDREAIAVAYYEGEFYRILPPLEEYRQSFPENSTRDDSIFVYKYLSVIYAADSSTRARAESYMVQLLKLKPTIELVDLYISDEIKAIFKEVKQSYLQEQKYIREYDLFGNAKRDSIPRDSTSRIDTKTVSTPKKSSRKWVWWTLGSIGTAAVATTAYIALGTEPETTNPSDGIKP
ncbi:MAG TPA: hypothetical protein VJ385_08420 [Fibrobacteria bacterium]|nr:hypothetical protein [Fibrobacteria bacterium]